MSPPHGSRDWLSDPRCTRSGYRKLDEWLSSVRKLSEEKPDYAVLKYAFYEKVLKMSHVRVSGVKEGFNKLV